MDLDEEIMRAIIQIGGSEGASFDNIKEYLSSALNQMPDSESIHSSLNNAVDKGLLSRLDNERYKIKETPGSVEDAHYPNRDGIDHLKKLINEANEIKKAVKHAEEAVKDAYSVNKELLLKLTIGHDKIRKTSGYIEEIAKDANRASKQLSLASINENDKTGETEEAAVDAHSIRKEFLPKLNNGKDKTKVAGNREEVLQDTNQNTDPSIQNVSPATKDDENVAISDPHDKKDIKKVLKENK